jgi:TolB-like protein
LRGKLASYYAQEGLGNGLRIQIPPGRYRPCVVATGQSIRAGVTFHPLACLSDDQRAHTFTHGLNDELGYRLHRVFQTPPRSAGVPAQAPDTSYTLEGSVRLEAQHLRTSIRLTDRGTGSIIWSEQLDHGFDLPIARQEQLATICCHVLCLRLGCGQRRETAA